MKLEFPYQLAGFIDEEPALGEPVYDGEYGWYPQIALKRRFKLVDMSEADLLVKLEQYCLARDRLTLRIGSLVRPDRMPVNILKVEPTPQLMAFHHDFIASMQPHIVSRYPERDGANYLPHITAEYNGKTVIDADHYRDREVTLDKVFLLKDQTDENSIAYKSFNLHTGGAMKTLTQDEFDRLLVQVDMKPRLKKELKFVSSTAHLPDGWSDYELIAIADRTGDKGVLLLQPGDTLYVAPYELSRRIVDTATGRDRAIICDFCYTWQPGSNAASITFTHAGTKHTVRFLCCGDLACSRHVRTATKAAVMSRAQLRENLSNDERVVRLKMKLQTKIEQLGLAPIVAA